MREAMQFTGFLVCLAFSCAHPDDMPSLDLSRSENLPTGWGPGKSDHFDSSGGVIAAPDGTRVDYYFEKGDRFRHAPYAAVEWQIEEDYSKLDPDSRSKLPGALASVEQYRIEGYENGRVAVIILLRDDLCILFSVPSLSLAEQEAVLPVLLLHWRALTSFPTN